MAEIRSIGNRFVPNEEIDQYEAEDAEADEIQNDPFITSLGSHIRSCWQEARDNKDEYLTDRLLKSLRLRKGEYMLLRSHLST